MTRIVRIVTGFALIVAGVFMLVLPGPGIVTIAGGLALLSKDLEWAGRLSDWMRERFSTYFVRETPTPQESNLGDH